MKVLRLLAPIAVYLFSQDAARAQPLDSNNLPAAYAAARVDLAKSLSTVHKSGVPDDPWKRVASPAEGTPEPIGFYSAGCLRGAVQLPLSGSGYEVMRPSRRRNFGHPELIDFIKTFAQDVSGSGLHTLLVGDMAQPRGGPTMSGHASHQTGLDVDIWYLQVPNGAKLSNEDRENLSSPEMVKGYFDGLTERWTDAEAEVLKLASRQSAVERIFVNPAIKSALCDAHQGEDWLSKLRPELGHGDHYHVRLKCPAGDASCRAQAPVPEGDGCDKTLAEWFTPEMRAKVKYGSEHPKPPTMPKLPPLCREVLAE